MEGNWESGTSTSEKLSKMNGSNCRLEREEEGMKINGLAGRHGHLFNHTNAYMQPKCVASVYLSIYFGTYNMVHLSISQSLLDFYPHKLPCDIIPIL